MGKSIIKFLKNKSGNYQAAFKTTHGRMIYLEIKNENNMFFVESCFYIDRVNGAKPKKLISREFAMKDLKTILSLELDKTCSDVVFSDEFVEKESFIESYINRQKNKILLILKEGNSFRTIFKNRYRREIYLEVVLEGNQGLISDCRYCDGRAEGKVIIPQGLTTIRYEHSPEKLLDIVNNELEGGFSAIAITSEHTIDLKEAICGRI